MRMQDDVEESGSAASPAASSTPVSAPATATSGWKPSDLSSVTQNNAFEQFLYTPGSWNGLGYNDPAVVSEMGGTPTWQPASWKSTNTDSLIEALQKTRDIEGARRFMDVDSIGKVASQIKQQAKLAGVQWDNNAGDAQRHILTHAKLLVDKGVTDLKQLRKENGNWVYGKEKRAVDIQDDKVGDSAYGDGMTDYKLTTDTQGRPIAYQSWGSSSDSAGIAAGLGLILSVVAPGAGTAVGGALGLTGTAASVVGSGIISGGLAAIGGADGSGILKSAVLGGATPALAAVPGISSLPAPLQSAVIGTIKGAATGNATKGALLGAITGATGGGTTTGDRLLRAIIGQALKKKVTNP